MITDYILDTETLGDPIMQIALLDCSTMLLHVWYPLVDEQLRRGLRVDSGTMAWWARSPATARQLGVLLAGDAWLADEMLDGEPTVIAYAERDPQQVIRAMAEHMSDTGRLWVRGPDYDLPRIRALAELCGEPDPVSYPRVMTMCLRTLDTLLGRSEQHEKARAHWPGKHDAAGDVLRGWLLLERARAAGLLDDEEAAA